MNSLGGRIELFLRGKYGVLQSNTLFKVWSLRDVVPAFWNICSQRKIIRQPADFRRLPPSNGKTAHVDVMMTRKIELNL